MEYLSSIVLWVIIIGFLVYKFVIQKNNNRKAAETGEDQKRVKQAVSALLKEPMPIGRSRSPMAAPFAPPTTDTVWPFGARRCASCLWASTKRPTRSRLPSPWC